MKGARYHEVIARKVTGASHKIIGKSNQDNYLIRQLGKITIISVADGHGSDKCYLSEYGSRIATHVFCDLISDIYKKSSEKAKELYENLLNIRAEQFPKHLIKNWQTQVIKDFIKRRTNQTKVSDENEILEKYGTTLLGLVLAKDYYFACQIGDGDIIARYEDGKIDRLISADKLLGVETKSMCNKDAWINVEISFSRPSNSNDLPTLFLLSTDGLSNSYASDEAFLSIAQDYFLWIYTDGLSNIAHKIPKILWDTSNQGSGDDITLAIAANVDRIREINPNDLSIQ